MATINFSKVKKPKLAELYGFSDMYKAKYAIRPYKFEYVEEPVINEWGEYTP